VREQGRDAEALALTELAERSAADDDIDAQVLWRAARAPILARTGAIPEAEAMARAALDMARQTELTDLLASTLVELASVLRQAGQPEGARSALDEAIDLYAGKRDLASERRARRMAAELLTS
jgi:hypothetical protein